MGDRSRIRNSVEFDFGKMFPRINMVDIHKFIRGLLKEIKIDEKCIFGVMALLQAPSQVVRMKFGDDHEGEFKRFLKKYEGVGPMVVGRGKIKVKIYDASLALKYVRIGDAPFELPITEVTGALRKYGAIMDARRDRYMGGDYLAGYQGWVTVQMVTAKDIPSYLDIGEYRVIVKYQGQKFTCRGCGKAGHVARECPDLNEDLYEDGKETEADRIKEFELIEEKKKREIEEARREAEKEEEMEKSKIPPPEFVQEPVAEGGEIGVEINQDEEDEMEDGEIRENDEANSERENEKSENVNENEEVTVINETQVENNLETTSQMNLYYYNRNDISKSPGKQQEIIAQRKKERKMSKNKLPKKGEDEGLSTPKRSYSDVAKSSSDDEGKTSEGESIEATEGWEDESEDESQNMNSPVIPPAKSMVKKSRKGRVNNK